MTKDAYYFSHDSNARHDTKLIKVRSKFGATGYALYFMTLEVLRDQTNYSIDISDIDAIAFDLQCERNAYLEFIEYSIEIGLLVKKNGKISSNSFLNRMELYEIKRGKARQSALKRWSNRGENGNAKAMRTHSEGNANGMHLKESKINIKEKEKEKEIQPVYEYYLKQTNKTKESYQLTSNRFFMIQERLRDGFTVDQLCAAIDRFLKDPWPERKKFSDIEYLVKSFETVEKWVNQKERKVVVV